MVRDLPQFRLAATSSSGYPLKEPIKPAGLGNMTCPIDPYQMGPAPTDHIALSRIFEFALSHIQPSHVVRPIYLNEVRSLRHFMITRIRALRGERFFREVTLSSSAFLAT